MILTIKLDIDGVDAALADPWVVVEELFAEWDLGHSLDRMPAYCGDPTYFVSAEWDD